MIVLRAAASTALLVFLLTGHASAQQDTPLPSRALATAALAPSAEPPGEILKVLERWTADYDEWQAWFAQWRNRREPGLWSTRERRPAPVPPVWLPQACEGGLEEEGTLGEACRALRASLQALEDETAFRAAQARANLESPQRTAWWSRVHLDGFWPMTRSGTSAFGIVGAHATMPVTRRFQVFVAPGVILMRLPGPDGRAQLTTATDWGFSYRLLDFRLPGFRRASSLHINMARVWVLGQSAVNAPGDLYVAGFSMTFNRR